jgi:hypothetical protein
MQWSGAIGRNRPRTERVGSHVPNRLSYGGALQTKNVVIGLKCTFTPWC